MRTLKNIEQMQFLSTASEIEKTLGQLIRRCDQLSLAVAWASRNTRCCDLLHRYQHKIEAAIVGTHFYQTDPEFIADFYMHPKVRFQLKPNGVFHPKTYFFQFGYSWSALVGSANFTRGGLGGNAETAVLVSKEDLGADEFYGSITAFLDEEFERATIFSETKLDAYRVVWAKQQLRLRRLSGDYGTSPNDKPSDRSPLEVEELALAWPDYVDRIKEDPHFHVEDRLRLLTKAREVFATQVPFSRMPLRDRQLIAGFSAKKDFDWRVFGSMEGYGEFKKAVNSGNQNLSDALDEIPMEGDVSEKHYRAYVSRFREALSIKDGTGAITRLLALKRPDIFLCLDSENRRKLTKSFGISGKLTPDNYWGQVIHRIQDAAWWLVDRPTNDAIAQGVWDGRTAFLDVLFYSPKKPIAKLGE